MGIALLVGLGVGLGLGVVVAEAEGVGVGVGVTAGVLDPPPDEGAVGVVLVAAVGLPLPEVFFALNLT